MRAMKLTVTISADHKLELTLPSDLPTGPAELILLMPGTTARADVLGMDVGKGWIADDFDAPLPHDLQSAFDGEGRELDP